MDQNVSVTKQPTGLNAVVERAAFDNWLAYKLWVGFSRQALTAAISLAYPRFGHDAIFARVVQETSDFPRYHEERHLAVEADLEAMNQLRGKRKGRKKISFVVDGKECTPEEIQEHMTAQKDSAQKSAMISKSLPTPPPPHTPKFVIYRNVYFIIIMNIVNLFFSSSLRTRLSYRDLMEIPLAQAEPVSEVGGEEDQFQRSPTNPQEVRDIFFFIK